MENNNKFMIVFGGGNQIIYKLEFIGGKNSERLAPNFCIATS